MLTKRNYKHDVFALALVALCVFLSFSLLTYDAADPPGGSLYPAPDVVQNACGRSGAWVADLLLRLFGFGAYLVLGGLWLLSGMLLARRPIDEPVVRTVGGVMTLAGVATFLTLAAPSWSPGAAIGPGGYLGSAGRTVLEMHFAKTGSYILLTSLIAAGLLLCSDYLLIRWSWKVAKVPARGAVKLHKIHQVRREARAAQLAAMAGVSAPAATEVAEAAAPRVTKSTIKIAASTPADEEVEEEEAAEPSIKIRGKRPAEVEDEVDDVEDAAEDEEVDEDADAEADEEESVEAVAEPEAGKPFRIKNMKKSERESVMEELEAASRQEDTTEYELPPIDLLLAGEHVFKEEHEKEVLARAKMLEKTFASFGFNVKVVEVETGPVIAQYEVELEAGLRLSKITSLADDLAIALRVPSVRIVAPIPGKNTVGIEVPNNERQLVRLREVIEETNGKAKKMKIPIFLGKDVAGNPMAVDLATLPHLLIAGRTGTGKSVCLNSIIVSMLMTRRPDEVKMLMIDPKMVELSPYKKLPHLMHPVVTDMRKAEAILAWAVEKMEERYALLARAGVRHITNYNQLGEEELMERLQPESEEERSQIPLNLPFIVIVADEMADLMMTAGKEVEQHIIRLAQKSRAVGIHLILATQKPTVDVITGLIKSNLPARIAFQVASRTDSRVVLDEMGADKLLGNGDMLFLWPGTSTLLRGQGTYLSDDEINSVVDFVGTTEQQFVKELVQLKAKDAGDGAGPGKIKNRDEHYEAAIDIVIREGRGSVSLLQRALGIGYGRAARLIDFMAEDGIVGDYNGSQAREVLITLEQWAEMSGQAEAEAPPAPLPKRSNKIVPPASESEPVAKKRRPPPKIVEEEEEEEDEFDDEVEDELDEAEEYEEDEEEEEVDDELVAEDDEEEAPFDAPAVGKRLESA